MDDQPTDLQVAKAALAAKGDQPPAAKQGISTLEVLRIHARAIDTLRKEFGMKHADGVALLNITLSYDINLRQIAQSQFNPFVGPMPGSVPEEAAEEPDGNEEAGE